MKNEHDANLALCGLPPAVLPRQDICQPLEVTVLWGKDLFSHEAKDMKEAIEWARMYPMATRVRVWCPFGYMAVVNHK